MSRYHITGTTVGIVFGGIALAGTIAAFPPLGLAIGGFIAVAGAVAGAVHIGDKLLNTPERHLERQVAYLQGESRTSAFAREKLPGVMQQLEDLRNGFNPHGTGRTVRSEQKPIPGAAPAPKTEL